MLQLNWLRNLDLRRASSPGRPAWISAASGLVKTGGQLFVVADDELQLGCFSAHDPEPGELLRLFPGELPDKLKPRKKHKPDLEILMLLPPFAQHRHGALLALGSGSTHNRCRAVLLPLNAQHQPKDAPVVLDATAAYDSWSKHVDELNLEGGWVHDNTFYLLQRGNKHHSRNAVLEMPLSALLLALAAAEPLPAMRPSAIHTHDLGNIDDIPLCFSDASVLPDGRWLFTAVAEDTDNAVDDGQCAGAAIGMMDTQQHLLWLRRVTPKYKLEGIDAVTGPDGIDLLLVTDADDLAIPGVLLGAKVTS